MEPLCNQQPAHAAPSAAEWLRLRPVVSHLYLARRWTMVQVSKHLRSLGYHVNTRMVRARISQWNLQRNNQVGDMVTALCLLDPDPVLWPSTEPRFMIRGRQVAVSEVLRYFRRKGIVNPIQWARSAPLDLRDDSAVTLLDNDSGIISGHGISAPDSDIPSPCLPSHSLALPISTLEQRAAASLRDYCTAYIGLGQAASHHEPAVHQFTIHGRFGDRMQEGLAQMMRHGPGAFSNFRLGFDLVRPLLSDCHPMAMAQFLAIACEMAASSAHSVLASLLWYSVAMADALRVRPPLVAFLRSLCCSARDSPLLLLPIAVHSLRAALAAFSEQSAGSWHGLYIQERLCDCFYHGRERGEGAAARSRLLEQQEAFYGPLARNVVWTLTNVADDKLGAGDVHGAERDFAAALARADHVSSGFGRAKLRFAALEGLAKAKRTRYDLLLLRSDSANGPDLACEHLRDAHRYLNEALDEAQIWFDSTSRRTARAREQQGYISNLLGTLDCPEEPDSGLRSCCNGTVALSVRLARNHT